MPRRAIAGLVAVAFAVTAFVLPGHPARAVAADTPDTTAWVTNGNVHAVVHAGGRTYLGGTFDQVGPNTGFGVPLESATGALAIASKVNGRVYTAVPDGAGGWFIGGNFTRVAGVSRHYAAHVRADGTAGGWNPSPDLPVYAIAFDGKSRVYIGGEFSTVRKSSADGGGDASVVGLAATKRTDGGLDMTAVLPTIAPGLDGTGARRAVKALALSPDQSRLYAGGTFTAIGGVARRGLAAVTLSGTPSVDAAWDPQPDAPVAALLAQSDRLFVGGAFLTIGGGSRTGFAVLGPSGAGALDPTWAVTADGAVNAFAPSPDGSRLYAGGAFTTIGGVARGRMAALSIPAGGPGSVVAEFSPAADGDVFALALSPDGVRLYAGGAFGIIDGHSRRFLAALDAATGAVDTTFNAKAAATVRAVATSPTRVYAGGDFTSVGGEIRRNIAVLGPDGRLDAAFSADTDGEVNALLLNGDSLYIGGTFKNIAPYTDRRHRGLVKVNAATGAVDTGFKANIDSTVMALALSGSHLYVGGNFSSVKDGSGVDHLRSKGASVNAATGAVAAWDPGADAGIRDIIVAPDHSTVYIAGDFRTVAGQARTRLAAVDPITAAPTGWSPTPPAMIIKMDLSADGSMVYLALGGGPINGNRAQAWRTDANVRVWDVKGDGDFQAVAATNSLIYIGGHFDYLNGTTHHRKHLAALDPATGAVQPWGPPIGGALGVLDLAVTSSHVYVAGEFDNIGSDVIQGIARFTNSGDTPPTTTSTTTSTTRPVPTTTPTTTPATQPPAGGGSGGNPDPPAGAAATKAGYWMVGSGGTVYNFGDAGHHGNAAPVAGTAAVDLEPTPSGKGYWVVTDRGAVSSHGDAVFFGAPAAGSLATGETVTSLSATPTGRGYWVFTSRGRVMNFGDAAFFGDMSKVTLNGPVLDSIPTTSGKGYYMVASDGGIFAFGDAKFYGSMGGQRLNAPVQSLVPDGDGVGYWLVASDGGIFAFQAGFRGSMGGTKLNKPVTGMVRFADGYLMVGEDGGIFNFSTKPFLGSLGANPPARPIVSVAALG